MLKKRGALALSINAIVILIIAITMLGLALGFTRGMFGKISTQIEEKISEEPEPSTSSAADPTTLSREVIVTQAGESEVLKVDVYNPSNIEWTGTGSGDKPNIEDCSSGLVINAQANTKTLKPTESTVYTVLFDIPDQAPGTYLCRVKVPSLAAVPGFEKYFKDLTIKIVQ